MGVRLVRWVIMHRIEGEYSDGDCSVRIEKDEPYLILNLERYYEQTSNRGPHCDFVYISFDNDKFQVYVVELKRINKITHKNKIRKSFQGKFPQTLKMLKKDIIPVLKLENLNRVQYYAVISIPDDAIDKVGQHMIKRDNILLGELRDFDEAWVTACGCHIVVKKIKIKKI